MKVVRLLVTSGMLRKEKKEIRRREGRKSDEEKVDETEIIKTKRRCKYQVLQRKKFSRKDGFEGKAEKVTEHKRCDKHEGTVRKIRNVKM